MSLLPAVSCLELRLPGGVCWAPAISPGPSLPPPIPSPHPQWSALCCSSPSTWVPCLYFCLLDFCSQSPLEGPLSWNYSFLCSMLLWKPSAYHHLFRALLFHFITSPCNWAGPCGAFPGRPLPHILCFSSSLKFPQSLMHFPSPQPAVRRLALLCWASRPNFGSVATRQSIRSASHFHCKVMRSLWLRTFKPLAVSVYNLPSVYIEANETWTVRWLPEEQKSTLCCCQPMDTFYGRPSRLLLV